MNKQVFDETSQLSNWTNRFENVKKQREDLENDIQIQNSVKKSLSSHILNLKKVWVFFLKLIFIDTFFITFKICFKNVSFYSNWNPFFSSNLWFR